MHLCHCPFAYLLLPLICARTEENIETVNDLVLSQEDKLQTHRTVREISRETGIHRSSLSQIICMDLRMKCFKRRRAQELTVAGCAARMKRVKLLLQKFRQYATDIVFFTDKKVFWVTSRDNRQNKFSSRLRELLKKKPIAFSSVQGCRHCAVCHCLTACQLCLCLATFQQLINITLCPAFLRKFVCQHLRFLPLQIQTF